MHGGLYEHIYLVQSYLGHLTVVVSLLASEYEKIKEFNERFTATLNAPTDLVLFSEMYICNFCFAASLHSL